MKTKNKIMSIFLLPLSFTLFLPTNSISANLSEEQEKLISDFEIFSAQLDGTVILHKLNEPPILSLTGSFIGDISEIQSANLTYDIKEYTESDYENITLNLTNDLVSFYQNDSEIYFLVRIPIYDIDDSGNLITLESFADYEINNLTINLIDSNNNVISSTYSQDFKFEVDQTIIDNGDQSYPKVIDAGFLNFNYDEFTVVFSDVGDYDLSDPNSYNLYFHYDLYDMYDDSDVPITSHAEKLNPVGETTYVSGSKYGGNYLQNYECNFVPGTFKGYKIINASFIFVPKNEVQKSSIFVYENVVITPDNTSNIIETDVNGVNDSAGDYYINDTYATLDFYYDQFENINSYAEYMKHIEISYDLTYNSPTQSGTTNHIVEAEEVDTMTPLLFNTPGLYYEEVNMDEVNLHYQYTLVFPNNASWDTVTIDNVYVHFPMGANELDGEKLTSTTIDYDYYYSSIVYQDLGITISWTNFTKDENFIW